MEKKLVQWLNETLPTSEHVEIGIGDDAAVLQVIDSLDQESSKHFRIVLTSDALIEGVHFDNSMSMQQVGRKALAVNLSDLASMAAQPIAAIISLCIPKTENLESIKELFTGMLPLAQEFDSPIVGGDTNSGSSELIISVTAIGRCSKDSTWTISNAQAGDKILVTGSFGGSRLEKHFGFQPRVHLASYLNANYSINAATDVSDGLSLDLTKIAKASQLGFVIDEQRIPISKSAFEIDRETAAKRTSGENSFNVALDHALGDGEDFELILAVDANTAESILSDDQFGNELTVIGEFTDDRNFKIRNGDGNETELIPRGYEH